LRENPVGIRYAVPAIVAMTTIKRIRSIVTWTTQAWIFTQKKCARSKRPRPREGRQLSSAHSRSQEELRIKHSRLVPRRSEFPVQVRHEMGGIRPVIDSGKAAQGRRVDRVDDRVVQVVREGEVQEIGERVDCDDLMSFDIGAAKPAEVI